MSGRVIVYVLGAALSGVSFGLWVFLTWPEEKGSGEDSRLIVPGQVIPSNGTAQIYPQARGRVLSVLVYEGEKVQEGQLLAEIDTGDLVAEVDRIQEQYQALASDGRQGRSRPNPVPADAAEDAQHRLEHAEAHAEGVVALFERGALAGSVQNESRQRLEVARARYETAQAAVLSGTVGASHRAVEAQVRIAYSALTEARSRLEWSFVRAPLSGVIVVRNVDPGDTLTSGLQVRGSPLFEIADVSQLMVRGEVPEKEAHRVRLGLSVVVSWPGGVRPPVLGRVLRRAARVEEGQGSTSSGKVLPVFIEFLGSPPTDVALEQSVNITIDTPRQESRTDSVLAQGN